MEQNNCCFLHHYTRRQCQCCTLTQQIQTDLEEEETRNCFNSTRVVMASSCSKISPIISIFVFFLFFIFSVCPVLSLEIENFNLANQTFKPGDELQKMKMIKSHLMKINKPSLKTIQVLPHFHSFPFPFCHLYFFFNCLNKSLNCDTES